MVFGQVVLGQSSDRFGRKPLIVLGILLSTSLYAGLVLVTRFPLMLLVAAVAGLGSALISPALSSYYLDITDEQYRARILGVKESSASLGGVLGTIVVSGCQRHDDTPRHLHLRRSGNVKRGRVGYYCSPGTTPDRCKNQRYELGIQRETRLSCSR